MQFCSILSVTWGIFNIHKIWELVPALVFRPWKKLFLLLWLWFTIRFRLNALNSNKLNTRPPAVRGKKVPSILDTYSVSIFRCRKQTSTVDHFKRATTWRTKSWLRKRCALIIHVCQQQITHKKNKDMLLWNIIHHHQSAKELNHKEFSVGFT